MLVSFLLISWLFYMMKVFLLFFVLLSALSLAENAANRRNSICPRGFLCLFAALMTFFGAGKLIKTEKVFVAWEVGEVTTSE